MAISSRDAKKIDAGLVLTDSSKQLINKFKKGIFTPKGMNYAAGKAADIIKDEAKSIVPVDTGALRDSIVVRTKRPGARRGIAATVTVDYDKIARLKGFDNWTDRSYPYIIEYGNARQSAQSYIRKARTKKRREAIKLFIDIVSKQANKEVSRF